jgi:hypothetical protein
MIVYFIKLSIININHCGELLIFLLLEIVFLGIGVKVSLLLVVI